MANGVITKAEAEWKGTIRIRDMEIKGSFLIFDSGSGWAFLLGKPILSALKAVHDYGDDVIKISDNKTQATLVNQYHDQRHSHVVGNRKLTLDIKQVTQQHECKCTEWMRIPNTGLTEHLSAPNKTMAEPTVPTYTTSSGQLETSTLFTRQTDPFNPR